MSRLFGTDGVRGVANTELTGEMAFNLQSRSVCTCKRIFTYAENFSWKGYPQIWRYA